jgi:hypothetical protein
MEPCSQLARSEVAKAKRRNVRAKISDFKSHPLGNGRKDLLCEEAELRASGAGSALIAGCQMATVAPERKLV